MTIEPETHGRDRICVNISDYLELLNKRSAGMKNESDNESTVDFNTAPKPPHPMKSPPHPWVRVWLNCYYGDQREQLQYHVSGQVYDCAAAALKRNDPIAIGRYFNTSTQICMTIVIEYPADNMRRAKAFTDIGDGNSVEGKIPSEFASVGIYKDLGLKVF